MGFQDQTVMVTGGSRGIGKAVCKAFALQGANVAFSYSGSSQAAEETARELREYGGKVLAVKSDVSKMEECQTFFEEAATLSGRIDVLVCNAGITKDTLLLRMSEEDFEKVLDVNLKGTFHCLKLASKIMLKQRYGRVINMASIVGLRGNPGQLNYAASKAGVIGMTKSMAKELARKNITVNAVAPGMIDTSMSAKMTDSAKKEMLGRIPCGRMGKPEDVAAAVLFFASPEAGYITGQVLCVDGGMAV